MINVDLYSFFKCLTLQSIQLHRSLYLHTLHYTLYTHFVWHTVISQTEFEVPTGQSLGGQLW